jgi:hypothetical protein
MGDCPRATLPGVTRRRSRVPGRIRPDRRRSLLLLCLAAILLVAACGGTSEATSAPTGDGAPATATPSQPLTTPEPTAEPATQEPATPEPPTAEPSDEPSASPSDDPGAAGACSGNDENREFFASIAEVVSWPVYCAVLPSGWFVDAGQYRLAGGGWLEIAYRGPGGARLESRQGTACADAGCLPSGEDLGGAAFGDLGGTLVGQDDGELAVVVGPTDGATWVLIGSGLEQATFAGIAADLQRVGD